ncbi:hypothetical protein HPP92_021344 [Vanilla planifolia]|uniref:Uncharacterized protein n=1 Tax=Vanilla planifolia TaxID=51239 RepID=A0A835Q1D5_VANPL|nr:hypothetical protein HPP92_021632 [Vanilla planifolia]KAG0462868.1 hypothetical protein HPP92_021344 [Vanilla planifolia]
MWQLGDFKGILVKKVWKERERERKRVEGRQNSELSELNLFMMPPRGDRGLAGEAALAGGISKEDGRLHFHWLRTEAVAKSREWRDSAGLLRPPQRNPLRPRSSDASAKDLFRADSPGAEEGWDLQGSSPIWADPATIGRLTSPETDDLGETGCKGPRLRGRQHAFRVGGFQGGETERDRGICYVGGGGGEKMMGD